jgi:hypothetical protein
MRPANTKWWLPDPRGEGDEVDKTDRAVALTAETSAVEMRQSSWHELNLWNATLFSNRELVGFRWGAIQAERELWPMNLRSENMIEIIGNALMSKASASPLRPSLVPHGNSLEIEKAVREADDFVFANWRATNSEEACVRSFLDAYISDLGCVQTRWDANAKKLCVEPVFFDNVIIDNRECINRQPPRTHRIRKVLPKATVESMYGVDFSTQQDRYVDYRSIADGWVVLVEAWRLPNEKGEGGRHCVSCCGMLLEDEEWNLDYVDLTYFHWSDMVSGFFGKSGVEQLVPYQVRQNELNDAIELSQDIACRARLLVHANSTIDVSQWDNEAGRFLMYAGVEPKPFLWPTNLGELYQERDRNWAKAYSAMAISEMFANADLPQGVRLDSSAGVREARNMEDAAHLRLWTRFEKFRLDVAKAGIRVLSRHPEAKAYSVDAHPKASRPGAKRIQYRALRQLAEDDYSWTLEAVPLSSMSPAARRELIRDWASRDLIDPNEERRMEGNPNLERIEDLEAASQDDILRHMTILENGDYEDPSELTNLTYGIPKITSNYHRLKDYEDVQQDVLDNHIRWILAGKSIQQQALADAQQQQAMYQPAPFAPTQGVPNSQAVPSGPPAQ